MADVHYRCVSEPADEEANGKMGFLAPVSEELHCSLKLRVTVMVTATGWPSRRAGSKRQPVTASSAAKSTAKLTLRRTRADAMQPRVVIYAFTTTVPWM